MMYIILYEMNDGISVRSFRVRKRCREAFKDIIKQDCDRARAIEIGLVGPARECAYYEAGIVSEEDWDGSLRSELVPL